MGFYIATHERVDLEFEGIELEGIAEGSDMALIREDCFTSSNLYIHPLTLLGTELP